MFCYQKEKKIIWSENKVSLAVSSATSLCTNRGQIALCLKGHTVQSNQSIIACREYDRRR